VTNSPVRGGKPVLNFNNANTMNFNDACRRHRDHHDRNWWRNHCHTIILIGSGFYAWDLGYWYPAYGYDSYYSNYAYDGPIYGYDGLPPDQIIANVQYALQQLGYFSEAVDGVLGPVTRAAIEDYQVENNLPVTGAIDRPLLVSLGFIY
jgi:putative peptidoglycan binding protein